MSDALIEVESLFRLGRTRALHRQRVLIEDGKVVVRTLCGLDAADSVIVQGIATCTECEAAS
jgi:hypothetical protein